MIPPAPSSRGIMQAKISSRFHSGRLSSSRSRPLRLHAIVLRMTCVPHSSVRSPTVMETGERGTPRTQPRTRRATLGRSFPLERPLPVPPSASVSVASPCVSEALHNHAGRDGMNVEGLLETEQRRSPRPHDARSALLGLLAGTHNLTSHGPCRKRRHQRPNGARYEVTTRRGAPLFEDLPRGSSRAAPDRRRGPSGPCYSSHSAKCGRQDRTPGLGDACTTAPVLEPEPRYKRLGGSPVLVARFSCPHPPPSGQRRTLRWKRHGQSQRRKAVCPARRRVAQVMQ